MSDIRLDLIYANTRGVAPPQNWTHRAVEEIERLRAELESLRRDAERYRWLRDGCDAKHGPATRIATRFYGVEWDAAIDAAMAKDAP